MRFITDRPFFTENAMEMGPVQSCMSGVALLGFYSACAIGGAALSVRALAVKAVTKEVMVEHQVGTDDQGNPRTITRPERKLRCFA